MPTRFPRINFQLLITIILVTLFTQTAFAGNNKNCTKPKPGPNTEINVKNYNKNQNSNFNKNSNYNHSTSKSNSHSHSNSNSNSQANIGDISNNNQSSATTGDLTSNIDLENNAHLSTGNNDVGVNIGGDTIVNHHTYLALSLRFPQAAGCFSGFQGGDQNGNSSKFLGFHILNNDCWMNVLAQQEGDIELNARLKCGSRKYRNAVSFEKRTFRIPLLVEFGKRSKQADCVERVMAGSLRTLRAMQAKLQQEHLRNLEIMREENLLKQELMPEPQVKFIEKECEDVHPHKENEKGYLLYNGETYINVDKLPNPKKKSKKKPCCKKCDK